MAELPCCDLQISHVGGGGEVTPIQKECFRSNVSSSVPYSCKHPVNSCYGNFMQCEQIGSKLALTNITVGNIG